MTRPLELCDLKDALLFRFQALDFIRISIVRSLDAYEIVNDELSSVPYLLGLVVADCRSEIANTFKDFHEVEEPCLSAK